MKLICPSCGATHSAEAWANDADACQCLSLVAGLPEAVSTYVLPYLGLFRNPASGRGMTWNRRLRILNELREMVGRGHIQRGQRPARPCPASVWGEALQRILDRPPRRLPLTGHGYLLEIVYDLADTLDRKAEVERNRSERTGSLRPQRERMEQPQQLNKDWMKSLGSGRLKGQS